MAQAGLKNINVVRVLVLFVVFYILTSPQAAGEQARALFEWVLDQGSSIGVFLDGLLSDPPAE